MKHEEEIEKFFSRVKLKMEMGAMVYGDRSFSRDPAELVPEILDELADVCGWAAVLAVRLMAMTKAIETPTVGSSTPEPRTDKQ